MPITSAAKKSLRQNPRRKAHNLQYKNKIKNLVKKALSFATQEKKEELRNAIPALYKAFDKAAKIGVMKKHTAARRKSRIARKLNQLLRPETPVQAKETMAQK
ncbi:MAG: 30S ribosomal protein S20 [Candidatus Spechtbacteria bacterium]|nr:30S ribosomal protein S20 [Candidatus Spechtbacteria bacterium]